MVLKDCACGKLLKLVVQYCMYPYKLLRNKKLKQRHSKLKVSFSYQEIVKLFRFRLYSKYNLIVNIGTCSSFNL